MHAKLHIAEAKGQRGIFYKNNFVKKKREIKGQNLIKKYFWGRNVKEVSNRKEWPESSVLSKANLRQGRAVS